MEENGVIVIVVGLGLVKVLVVFVRIYFVENGLVLFFLILDV